MWGMMLTKWGGLESMDTKISLSTKWKNGHYQISPLTEWNKMEDFIHQNSSVITTNKDKNLKGSWLKLRATYSEETHMLKIQLFKRDCH